ncbi:hypothetical protein K435DRAFT_785063 [Dendrothele bispora CBS 962.96]|uniref:Retrovirus-related Pol polyprotein from transposon TNT 1-94-like beta-barrel domain-containing protein n=1 Tax=Dendrothele bispora (strain CBS 962.96) TaxID=1314807 RepID=A0A4V4HBZ5_DENBC|nr:hypothetical protein K435DRAFT_785063 [Dendrothele bispora CBS 962.96]
MSYWWPQSSDDKFPVDGFFTCTCYPHPPEDPWPMDGNPIPIIPASLVSRPCLHPSTPPSSVYSSVIPSTALATIKGSSSHASTKPSNPKPSTSHASIKPSKPSTSTKSSMTRTPTKPLIPPTTAVIPSSLSTRLLLDSVLTFNVIWDRAAFSTYTPQQKTLPSSTGHFFNAVGFGTVDLRVTALKQEYPLRLTICYHVPSASRNILSTSCLMGADMQIILSNRSPRILLPLKTRQASPSMPKYYPLSRERTHFYLKAVIVPNSSSVSTSTTNPIVPL